MAEHCFQFSLSIEEIGENFRDFDLLLDSWSRWKRFWTTHTAKNPPGVIVHERALPGPEPAGEGRPHPASLTAPIEKRKPKAWELIPRLLFVSDIQAEPG